MNKSDIYDEMFPSLYSALGDDPVCDLCKESITEGQEIAQAFIGRVFLHAMDGELCVMGDTYTVAHITCAQSIRGKE